MNTSNIVPFRRKVELSRKRAIETVHSAKVLQRKVRGISPTALHLRELPLRWTVMPASGRYRREEALFYAQSPAVVASPIKARVLSIEAYVAKALELVLAEWPSPSSNASGEALYACSMHSHVPSTYPYICQLDFGKGFALRGAVLSTRILNTGPIGRMFWYGISRTQSQYPNLEEASGDDELVTLQQEIHRLIQGMSNQTMHTRRLLDNYKARWKKSRVLE